MGVEIFEIPSHEVRLPARAVEVLAAHRPVGVTRYGHRQHVILAEEQFVLIAPLLELLSEGAGVSPELLMTKEDIELLNDLAEEDEAGEAEAAQVAELLAEAEGS